MASVKLKRSSPAFAEDFESLARLLVAFSRKHGNCAVLIAASERGSKELAQFDNIGDEASMAALLRAIADNRPERLNEERVIETPEPGQA